MFLLDGVKGADFQHVKEQHAQDLPTFVLKLGPENSKRAFVDNTHHNNYGSYELAKCIVEGIKANRLGIARFLVDEAQATFDPAHPDPVDSVKVPPSPRAAASKPDGN